MSPPTIDSERWPLARLCSKHGHVSCFPLVRRGCRQVCRSAVVDDAVMSRTRRECTAKNMAAHARCLISTSFRNFSTAQRALYCFQPNCKQAVHCAAEMMEEFSHHRLSWERPASDTKARQQPRTGKPERPTILARASGLQVLQFPSGPKLHLITPLACVASVSYLHFLVV